MPQSGKEIKRRICSVKNTRQITKAMEMVSASKMRRSQEAALHARPYALKALEVLSRLGGAADIECYPLLQERAEGKIGLVLISTDKGLCGGLNSTLFKKTAEFIRAHQKEAMEVITIGKKAGEWALRMNLSVSASFEGYGDRIDVVEVLPLARSLIKDFEAGRYKKIVFAYTNFISTLKQEPVIRHLLPIKKESLEEVVKEILPTAGKYAGQKDAVGGKIAGEYIFEPSSREVLNNLLPKLTEVQVYQMVLEANASEHSARMVAMKNASEAAKEMIEELALSYNKVRQAGITQEIAEISAGKAALEQ